MNYTPDHNFFDFRFLPQCLNDIINNDAQGMINQDNKKVHQRHFKPCLDNIKSLQKRYDMNETNGFVIYALDMNFEDECEIFGDNNMIFTFPLEQGNYEEICKRIDAIEPLEFDEEDEDENELIEMEINNSWIDVDMDVDMN